MYLLTPPGAVSAIGDEASTPATPVVASAGMTTQTKLLIGAGLVAAYLVFFKKKTRTLTRNPSTRRPKRGPTGTLKYATSKRRPRRGPTGTLKYTSAERTAAQRRARAFYLANRKV